MWGLWWLLYRRRKRRRRIAMMEELDIIPKPKPNVESPKPKPSVESPKPKPSVTTPKPKRKIVQMSVESLQLLDETLEDVARGRNVVEAPPEIPAANDNNLIFDITLNDRVELRTFNEKTLNPTELVPTSDEDPPRNEVYPVMLLRNISFLLRNSVISKTSQNTDAHPTVSHSIDQSTAQNDTTENRNTSGRLYSTVVKDIGNIATQKLSKRKSREIALKKRDEIAAFIWANSPDNIAIKRDEQSNQRVIQKSSSISDTMPRTSNTTEQGNITECPKSQTPCVKINGLKYMISPLRENKSSSEQSVSSPCVPKLTATGDNGNTNTLMYPLTHPKHSPVKPFIPLSNTVQSYHAENATNTVTSSTKSVQSYTKNEKPRRKPYDKNVPTPRPNKSTSNMIDLLPLQGSSSACSNNSTDNVMQPPSLWNSKLQIRTSAKGVGQTNNTAKKLTISKQDEQIRSASQQGITVMPCKRIGGPYSEVLFPSHRKHALVDGQFYPAPVSDSSSSRTENGMLGVLNSISPQKVTYPPASTNYADAKIKKIRNLCTTNTPPKLTSLNPFLASMHTIIPSLPPVPAKQSTVPDLANNGVIRSTTITPSPQTVLPETLQSTAQSMVPVASSTSPVLSYNQPPLCTSITTNSKTNANSHAITTNSTKATFVLKSFKPATVQSVSAFVLPATRATPTTTESSTATSASYMPLPARPPTWNMYSYFNRYMMASNMGLPIPIPLPGEIENYSHLTSQQLPVVYPSVSEALQTQFNQLTMPGVQAGTHTPAPLLQHQHNIQSQPTHYDSHIPDVRGNYELAMPKIQRQHRIHSPHSIHSQQSTFNGFENGSPKLHSSHCAADGITYAPHNHYDYHHPTYPYHTHAGHNNGQKSDFCYEDVMSFTAADSSFIQSDNRTVLAPYGGVMPGNTENLQWYTMPTENNSTSCYRPITLPFTPPASGCIMDINVKSIPIETGTGKRKTNGELSYLQNMVSRLPKAELSSPENTTSDDMSD